MPTVVANLKIKADKVEEAKGILKQLAEDYAGRVRIVKMHAAENMVTSGRYGVRAMPTVLAFRDGELRGQLVGARKKGDFENLIGQMIDS